MDVQVSLWGVLLAAVAAMVIGMIWYARGVPTGKMWMALTKDNKQVKGRSMGFSVSLAFLMALLLAYVIAYLGYVSYKFFGGSFTKDVVVVSLWLWAGVAFNRALTMDSFEMRPFKLTAVNTANSLVTMVVMALVIGWVGF